MTKPNPSADELRALKKTLSHMRNTILERERGVFKKGHRGIVQYVGHAYKELSGRENP